MAYQEINGAYQDVKSHYELHDQEQVGFRVASYDTRHPLIIDPVLTYSTYLGGSNQDVGGNLAIDSSGPMYLTGITVS
ncbi:MAG: hypothetical protein OET79_06425, partial [Nitrospirota bacterium]|nr:hypothetical protein [Nitrospirota bacterium]